MADVLSEREQALRRLLSPYSLVLRLRDAGVVGDVISQYVNVEQGAPNGLYRIAEAKLLAAQKTTHGPPWHIGVEKAWHGYGTAQALVGRLRERADVEAAGLYGNCQKRLMPFYAEVFPDGLLTGTTTLGRRGPAFYFLYREPVSQHAEPTAGQ